MKVNICLFVAKGGHVNDFGTSNLVFDWLVFVRGDIPITGCP